MLAGRALAYYLFSRRRPGKGLQHPFLTGLVQDVFSPDALPEECKLFREVRKDYLSDRSRITPHDLGAGHKSRKSPAGNRSIRNIARHSSGHPRYYLLLCRLSRYARPAAILELGTALGLGTLALALGNPEAHITTIEGDPALAARAREMLNRTIPGHPVTLLQGAFDDILPSLPDKTGPLDLIFLDGNHEKEATLRYFNLLLPSLRNKSIAVIDDIHWSKGMLAAWDILRDHPETTLAIDIFRMGILFFDPALPKQTVTLRY